MLLKNVVGLITGGSRGLGRSFAKTVLENGGKVAIVDINKKASNALMSEISKDGQSDRCIFIECDVTKTDLLSAAFAKAKHEFGQLNVVCNNAGMGDERPEHMLNVLDLNLTAVIQGTQEGVKHLCYSSGGTGGVIINVGSMSGIHPLRGAAVYTASKFGVLGYTQALKGKYKSEGIRVNCLCPSFVKTDLLDEFVHSSGDRMEKFVSRVGLVTIEAVTRGFVRILEDDTLDGDAVCVMPGAAVSLLESRQPSFKPLE